jgi:hypothetical protein
MMNDPESFGISGNLGESFRLDGKFRRRPALNAWRRRTSLRLCQVALWTALDGIGRLASFSESRMAIEFWTACTAWTAFLL